MLEKYYTPKEAKMEKISANTPRREILADLVSGWCGNVFQIAPKACALLQIVPNLALRTSLILRLDFSQIGRMKNREYYTVAEAAKASGISAKRIRKMLSLRLVPCVYDDLIRAADVQRLAVKGRAEGAFARSFEMPVIPLGSYVYFLMCGNSIVYVGITDNPMRRIGQHLRDRVKTFDSVRLVRVRKGEVRDLEREVVAFHNPKHNQLLISRGERL